MGRLMKSEPLYKQVYRDIKQSILKGKLKPGARIDVNKLAEQYEISRTPLREALRQLEKEGLLNQDKMGTSVVKLEEKDLEELCECRLLLETKVIQLVVDKVTSEEIEKMQSFIDRSRTSYDEGDLMETFANNTKFHETIVYACPNNRLIELLNIVRSLTTLYRAEVLNDYENVIGIINEHQKILDALKSRDVKKALGAVQIHLENDQIRGKRLFKQ